VASQDWLEKDFYAILGVSKDVSEDELKKTYRSLARKHHPDSNQGDAAAEARLKFVPWHLADRVSPPGVPRVDLTTFLAACLVRAQPVVVETLILVTSFLAFLVPAVDSRDIASRPKVAMLFLGSPLI
jgi:hypothetical protein